MARSVVPARWRTSHLLAALVFTVVCCCQGMVGFGTDPQMPAVPSIGSSVCFHLPQRLASQLLSSPWLASIPSPMSALAAYELCRLNEVSSSLDARIWCSGHSSIHFQLSLSRWVNVSMYHLSFILSHAVD